jgi:TrpR-related protein YerC/YecD
MTKLSRKILDPEHFGRYINNLWSAFTLMESKEDIRLLFKDLFTHTEYKMFAKRLEIARRLMTGERYDDIKKQLNVTANTISRINNILNEKGDGLRKAHGKLEQLEEKYLAKQREHTKNLENPFRKKIKDHGKTVLGELLKGGIKELDKTILKKLKQRTAKRALQN